MSRAPLIRIKLQEGSELRNHTLNLDVQANKFVANHLTQPFVKELEFKGGLIQIDSDTTNGVLYFSSNQLEDNYVRGGDASLIYVQGLQIKAYDNKFFKSGSIDTTWYSYEPLWEVYQAQGTDMGFFGSLKKNQVKKALVQAGIYANNYVYFDREFDEMDRNNDTLITYEEFKQYVNLNMGNDNTN